MKNFCNLSFKKFILHLETIITFSLRTVKICHVYEEKIEAGDGFDKFWTRHS